MRESGEQSKRLPHFMIHKGSIGSVVSPNAVLMTAGVETAIISLPRNYFSCTNAGNEIFARISFCYCWSAAVGIQRLSRPCEEYQVSSLITLGNSDRFHCTNGSLLARMHRLLCLGFSWPGVRAVWVSPGLCQHVRPFLLYLLSLSGHE